MIVYIDLSLRAKKKCSFESGIQEIILVGYQKYFRFFMHYECMIKNSQEQLYACV